MSRIRELQAENERLRRKLEEVYDLVGDALGFEDDSENDRGDEDRESDASDLDDEE